MENTRLKQNYKGSWTTPFNNGINTRTWEEGPIWRAEISDVDHDH